jgi:hypothetical protein
MTVRELCSESGCLGSYSTGELLWTEDGYGFKIE